MTKFKVCSKIHLFIFISVIFIAIGMATGTICHYLAGGFFNYGGEFSSYKSVSITYYYSEHKADDDVKGWCDAAFEGLNPQSVTYATSDLGEEWVYKFSVGADSEKLQTAAATINAKFEGLESSATVGEGYVKEGGSKNIIYASIALASAVAFQFLYFILRYKLRSAYSALLACVHNVGIYAALLAVTRIPVGTEAVAIGAAVAFVTMLLSGILFDRTRKNFKNEKYAKTDREEVVEISASEVRVLSFTLVCALAAAAVVLGVFAAISALYIGALAPCGVAVIGLVACLYGSLFFTPAVHAAIDGRCEKTLASLKSKPSAKPSKKAPKAEKTAKTVSEEN